jgi:hypothetical protein
MPHQSHQFTTDIEDSQLPPYSTGTEPSVIEWVLQRFTNPAWTVDSLSLEQNSHINKSSPTVLETSLSHTSGSILQCIPFDPVEHTRETPVYTANRVRLRDATAGKQYYVTVEHPDLTQQRLLSVCATASEHPYTTLGGQATFHKQAEVHTADSEINRDEERQFVLSSLPETLLAIFGGAQRVTRNSETQASLTAFSPGS